MRSRSEHSTHPDRDVARELAVLSEVHEAPNLTQRELAGRVGLSLGATNLLLQNLASKGYLRIRRAGWRRWLYAVTPAGMKRKITLTGDYVSRFMDQYSQVRSILGQQLDPLAATGERVAVYGRGDLVRLVHLVLGEMGLQADVFGVPSDDGSLPGMDVLDVGSLTPGDYGRIVIADLKESAARVEELLAMNVDESCLEVLFYDRRVRRK